jgi:hypothetical protein
MPRHSDKRLQEIELNSLIEDEVLRSFLEPALFDDPTIITISKISLR